MGLMPNETTQRKERALLFILAGMLVMLILFFSSLMIRKNREFQQFEARQARIEAKLLQAQQEFEKKEVYLARLLNDPQFLESVVRERFGYSSDGEVIFKFTSEP